MINEDIRPREWKEKFGKPTIRRGKLVVPREDGKDKRTTFKKDIVLVSWDALPNCTENSCKIFDKCNITEGMKESKYVCGVMKNYLKSISLILFRNYGDKLDELQWTKIGLELLPLYRNLVRMKIYELGLVSITTTSRQGNIVINPIYREMREQMKVIELIWKSLNLGGIPLGVGDIPPDDDFDGDEEAIEIRPDGDPNYYDNMLKDIQKEKEERQEKRDKGEKVKKLIY